MKKYGLIGFPLGHSFSKKYFTEKFEREKLSGCTYDTYPLHSISELPDFLQWQPELEGLNVTIPYKEQVIPYLDELDPEAEKIGAVNAIKITRSDNKTRLEGYNTDVFGFEQPLSGILKPWHTAALVLGTGGAAKAVVFVLAKLNIEFRYVSRNPKNSGVLSYADVTPELVHQHKLIINTSPVGMFPNVSECPAIPYAAVGPEHILYDLVYNPEKTIFLKRGEEKKATLLNGLPMLYAQAERSWQIWNS